MADDSLSKENLNVVKDYLKIQGESFKSFVNLLMDNFNNRFDSLTREVQRIKDSLEFTQKDVEVLQKSQENLALLESKIEALKREIKDNQDKIDYLENQSRRNNIRISGLDEDDDENWNDTELKVKRFLNSKLEFPYPEDIEMERAHRTGKVTQKPRQVVVKFLRYKDKEKALKNGYKLKGTGVYMNEDLSSRVMERRKQQQEALANARKEGKIAYFNVDRLIIKDRRPLQQTSLIAPYGKLGASAGYRSSPLTDWSKERAQEKDQANDKSSNKEKT